ncbi:MAG: DegV family protein [Lachnospiraceae bacterium]
MNEQKTAVLIDSGCDIPEVVRRQYDIRMISLRVIYPERDYRDGVDIDPLTVYNRFPNELPTTSTPSIAEVMDEYESLKEEGFEHVIAVTISASLSGTNNTFRLAALEEEDLDVFVFDSKNISMGAGLFAIWAARMLKLGKPYHEVCSGMQEKIRDSKVFFYMDTLKYLQRGGRIGKVAGAVGSVLQIKPIISCDEAGTYYTEAKIRGARLAKIKLAEEVVKYCFGHKVWIVIEEGNAHEEAMAMQAMLESALQNAEILFEQQITATLAVNTGPGLVGVAIFREPGTY